ASHRMVDRVHRHATHMRATPLPTSPPRFTTRYIHVIDISHLADRGEAVFVNATDFSRGHLHQRVTAFEVIYRCLLPGAARNLTSAAGTQFNIVNIRAERNRAKW